MTVPSRPRILGILNVTPDSFSDGGLWADQEGAIARGLTMWADGADFIDVGGESTRPGAQRPELAAELERVLPVIDGLAAEGVACSIDTMRATVAAAAVEAGACLINDVSGGLADPEMLETAAGLKVDFLAMHWRAHSVEMQDWASYPDGVVQTVCDELAQRRDDALEAGIDPSQLILDPGLGFAKTATHNWELLQDWARLAELGQPLLAGASRKSFLGALLADSAGQPRDVGEREAAHLAILTHLAGQGIWGVRVHDVRATSDAFAALTQLGAISE